MNAGSGTRNRMKTGQAEGHGFARIADGVMRSEHITKHSSLITALTAEQGWRSERW